MKETKEQKLRRMNAWVYEAAWAASEWRAESWRDCEMMDGGASSWTQEDWDEAQDAGIDPITINRTFPSVNKLLGGQVINRFDIIAKGRTKDDSEIGQVMTEGIKYVMDQYEGEFLISAAHSDALIPGFGCLHPYFNNDPRKERVGLMYWDWREVWWDPFSSPWFTPTRTRYVFRQPWMDLEDFIDLFPEKRRQIKAAYDEYAGQWREYGNTSIQDEAQQREEKIRTLSASDWIDDKRKRIRPAELYYPVNETCLFSLFPDGRCFEIKDDMSGPEAYGLIKSAAQVLKATVKKMRSCVFFGEHLELQDIPSPYPHDQYPVVPFIGYIDRWGFPYGVPRQIRGENEEVNKRRSMALAMLKKRRVIIEKDAAPSETKEALDALYDEANKLDGFMVLKAGGLQKFKIEELANLSTFQLELLRQAEYEIRDITGSDAPLFSGEQGQSGVAKQQDQMKSAMTTATLTDNLRRSMNQLGYQIAANIQGAWKYEKVLRVTDRLTGAERFVSVNQPLPTGEVRNDITQTKFDLVVTEAPVTDTVRERNLQILEEAIKKIPPDKPEALATLLIASFEMSDLPNKEILIEKLKPILGLSPEDEEVSPEEAKQRALDAVKQQQQMAQLNQQLTMEAMQIELNQKKLENLKLQAEIEKLKADTQKVQVETAVTVVEAQEQSEDHADAKRMGVVDGIERGVDIYQKLHPAKQEGKGGQAN